MKARAGESMMLSTGATRRWVVFLLLSLACPSLASSPFLYPAEPPDPDSSPHWLPVGAVSVMTDAGRLAVITADTLVSGEGFCFEYLVQGIRLSSGDGRHDTLLWLADLPASALAEALGSGAMDHRELRSLSIISCTGAFVCCRMELETGHPDSPSFFSTYRTWLLEGGVGLSIDDVIQRDEVYYATLRQELEVPQEESLDQWLWNQGFWSEDQSFALMPGPESPWLLIGFPSWQGHDTLLTVTLPVSALTTAVAAMMD